MGAGRAFLGRLERVPDRICRLVPIDLLPRERREGTALYVGGRDEIWRVLGEC